MMHREYEQRKNNLQIQETIGVWEEEVMRKFWVSMCAGGIERKRQMKQIW